MKQYLKIISVFISVFLLGAAIAPGPLPGSGGSVFNPSATKLSSFAQTTSSELAGTISNETGSGLLVFGTSPTLTTPTLGAATATSLNKLVLTTPTTGATLTLADNSSLITSGAYSTTLTATGTTSLTLPTTGTLATTSNNLSAFSATSSAQLAGILSDETGSGAAVFATSPSLTTPNIGVATATSVNKVAITAPASNATLALADGSTLTTAGAYGVTLTATGATSLTLPPSGTLLSTAATVSVAQGGTGATSLTAHYVPIGNGTSAVTMISPSAAGYVLTSNGTGSDPSFQAASGSVDPGQTQFRLSPSTGTAVVTSTVTNAASIFAVPYKGNKISLYYNSAWLSFSTAQMTLSLTGFTASKNYDVFCYASSGTTPTLEGLVWTNDTTRATALTTQDGVLVKSGDATRKYLGTIRIDSSGGQVDYQFGSIAANGGAGDFGVWNYWNRVPVLSFSSDTTDNWTYSTATWRAGNNSATFRHSFVCGWQEDAIKVTHDQLTTSSSSAVSAYAGIGIDSTTSPSGVYPVANAMTATPNYAAYAGTIAPGYHYVAGLEKSSGATASFYGDNGGLLQSGLYFEFLM